MHLNELRRLLRSFIVLIMAASCSAGTVTITVAALAMGSPDAVPPLLAAA